MDPGLNRSAGIAGHCCCLAEVVEVNPGMCLGEVAAVNPGMCQGEAGLESPGLQLVLRGPRLGDY